MLMWLLGILGLPADSTVMEDQWENFQSFVVMIEIIAIVFGLILVLSFYSWAAYRRKLPNADPEFLFKPYKPMRWLWASLLPLAVVWGVYVWKFYKIFPNATISPEPDGGLIGLETGLLVFLLALAGMWIPFKYFRPTPVRFKYRPFRLFVLRPHK
jgi:hypothetical protein